MSTPNPPAAASKTPATTESGRGPRHVTDTSKVVAEYSLNGKVFRQYAGHLNTVTTRDGEEQEYPVLTGSLGVNRVTEIRDVTRECLPGKIVEITYGTEFAPPGEESRDVTVSDVDMRSPHPQWPQETGAGAFMVTRKSGVETVSDAIRAAGIRARAHGGARLAYGVPGLLLRDGKPPAFLRIGAGALVPSGIDNTVWCELPSDVGDDVEGLRPLGMDDPSTDEQYPVDLNELGRISGIIPRDPAVGITLVSTLMWAPWAGLPDNRGGRLPHLAVMLAGTSGLMKSASVGLLLAAQSRTFVPTDEMAHVAQVKLRHGTKNGGSSIIGAQRLLYYVPGTAALVDDAMAAKMTASQVDEQYILLSGLADSMADQNSGVKATRLGQGLKASLYPRSCIVATAEDLPDEEQHVSELARFFALKTEHAADVALLTELQANARALSRAHARTVQDTLSDLDAPFRARAWAKEQMSTWDLTGVHSRVRTNTRCVLAGWHLFCDGVRHAGWGNADEWEAYGLSHVHDAMRAQALRGGMVGVSQIARDPVVLFLRHFRTLLADGVWHLAAPERGDDGAAIPPTELGAYGRGPAAVGWKQAGRSAVDETEPAAQWFTQHGGDPLGAVHIKEPGTPGPRQFAPVMLVMKSADWEEVARAVSRRARERDGFGISDTPARLLARLVEHSIAKSSTATNGKLWESKTRNTPMVYRFDLLRLLGDDIEEGHGDAGPDDVENGPASPAGATEPETEPRPFDPRCIACGEPTSARGDGSERDRGLFFPTGVGPVHVGCDVPPAPEPVQASIPEQAPEPVQKRQEPEQAATWQDPALNDDSLHSVRQVLTDGPDSWDGPDDDGFLRQVGERVTAAFPRDGGSPGSGGPGLVWAEGPGRTGYRLFSQVQGQVGKPFTANRYVDMPTPARSIHDLWHRPLTKQERGASHVVSVDVNGQYLAACSHLGLGTGMPTQFTHVESRIKRGRPAFYRLALDSRAAEQAPTLIDPDGWYATEAAIYWAEAGFVLGIEEASVWQETPKAWLDRFYPAGREAPAWLSGPDNQDNAGQAALRLAKAMYAAFLGSYLHSDKTTSALFRPDWHHMVVARAKANQYRALDDVREQTGRTPFAIEVDAAYFTADGPDDVPAGLMYSVQLGKWKTSGFGLLTPDVVAACDGNPQTYQGSAMAFKPIRKAIKEDG